MDIMEGGNRPALLLFDLILHLPLEQQCTLQLGRCLVVADGLAERLH